MYEFAWRSPVANGLFGACHALEIPFVFDTLDQGSGQMLGNLLGDDPPQSLASAIRYGVAGRRRSTICRTALWEGVR